VTRSADAVRFARGVAPALSPGRPEFGQRVSLDLFGGMFFPCQRSAVEVKIGIQSVPRELVLETASSYAEIESAVRDAVADGAVFILQDDKGGRVLVPADKLAYVEVGRSEPRRIGFGQ